MSPPTLALIEELIRHGRGALSSLEKWLTREREAQKLVTPIPRLERSQKDDRLHA